MSKLSQSEESAWGQGWKEHIQILRLGNSVTAKMFNELGDLIDAKDSEIRELRKENERLRSALKEIQKYSRGYRKRNVYIWVLADEALSGKGEG